MYLCGLSTCLRCCRKTGQGWKFAYQLMSCSSPAAKACRSCETRSQKPIKPTPSSPVSCFLALGCVCVSSPFHPVKPPFSQVSTMPRLRMPVSDICKLSWALSPLCRPCPFTDTSNNAILFSIAKMAALLICRIVLCSAGDTHAPPGFRVRLNKHSPR